MKLTIVGGYHDRKVIEVDVPIPIRIIEDLPEVGFTVESPCQDYEIKYHEYFPQSIKFAFYDELVVLVPHGQDVKKTVEMLINSYGEIGQ